MQFKNICSHLGCHKFHILLFQQILPHSLEGPSRWVFFFSYQRKVIISDTSLSNKLALLVFRLQNDILIGYNM